MSIAPCPNDVPAASAPPAASKPTGRPGRVLIVDDEELNIDIVRRYLQRSGYSDFESTTDPGAALSVLRAYRPDVVLLDVMMPKVSGVEILQQIRAIPRFRLLPVLILTANTDPETKRQCLELGATDFLQKPVDAMDLVPRVRNALVTKAYQDRLTGHAMQLEKQVRERTRELEESRRQIIRALARAAEYRDNDTGYHVCRVGRYAGIIARQLGLPADFVESIELAAQLHDVGKIGIEDSILLKPGKLEPEEYERIKQHVVIGRTIIEPLDPETAMLLRKHTEVGPDILSETGSDLMNLAARIAQTHHERWDGNGYPLGLAGDDIPIEGRIVAVADVFDALSSVRPYKAAMPREKCFRILEEGRGTQFDPAVLDAFFAQANVIVEVQMQLMDRP